MRLLRRLWELQEHHGYLREEDLRALSRDARVPLYHLEGLASFYTHFRRTPPRRFSIHLCRDMSCWLANGPAAAEAVRRRWGDDPNVEICETSCLGRCDHAPSATLNDLTLPVNALRADDLQGLLDSMPRPAVHTSGLCADGGWLCDPYSLPDEYYGGFREMLGLDPSALVSRVAQELKAAGLRGMGGAGFPAGTKWELVRSQSRTPKYVICNADESEPGTFKDRVILNQLPHLVIEGMLLAGLAVGASHGIIFIRHHYEPERQTLEQALVQARAAGVLGTNILGSDFNFNIEIFVSPGGYILGEETALLEALEDKRGEPRNKPPFPGVHGLNGQPTLINNVETLAIAASIIRNGGKWWKRQGRPGFSGLKFVAVSGHVERPGVYETAMGTPIRELLDRAGGVLGDRGRKLLAFAPGGASSNFLPPEKLDTPLDFNALAQAGSMLGSGALVVVAEGTDLFALGVNVTRFFRNESCGKCVPCRIGTEKAVELLEAFQAGRAPRQSLDVLPELNETLAQTSICGLGQIALGPVLSILNGRFDEASLSESQILE